MSNTETPAGLSEVKVHLPHKEETGLVVTQNQSFSFDFSHEQAISHGPKIKFERKIQRFISRTNTFVCNLLQYHNYAVQNYSEIASIHV